MFYVIPALQNAKQQALGVRLTIKQCLLQPTFASFRSDLKFERKGQKSSTGVCYALVRASGVTRAL